MGGAYPKGAPKPIIQSAPLTIVSDRWRMKPVRERTYEATCRSSWAPHSACRLWMTSSRGLCWRQLPPCRSCHPVALGIPIRRNHRKCDTIPARNDLCSAYLIPKSRHVSSTSLESAG